MSEEEILDDAGDNMTAQSRAARATYLLMIRRSISTAELRAALGFMNVSSVYPLMDNLSAAGVPVYQPDIGLWALNRERLGRLDSILGEDRRSLLE